MYHTRLGSVLVVSVMLASLAVVLHGVDAAGAQPNGAEAAGSQSGVSGSQTNIPTPAAPGEALNTIPADQAKEHIGETNTVCGLVASARYMDSTRAKPTLLNFVRPYLDHAFSVMIPNSARPKFKDPPEEFFTNKTVCVTGAIIEYRGKPEIVVEIAGALGTSGMIGGQVVDIESEGKPASRETLEYIHKNKTAVFIRACVRAGALLAGAHEGAADQRGAYETGRRKKGFRARYRTGPHRPRFTDWDLRVGLAVGRSRRTGADAYFCDGGTGMRQPEESCRGTERPADAARGEPGIQRGGLGAD